MSKQPLPAPTACTIGHGEIVKMRIHLYKDMYPHFSVSVIKFFAKATYCYQICVNLIFHRSISIHLKCLNVYIGMYPYFRCPYKQSVFFFFFFFFFFSKLDGN